MSVQSTTLNSGASESQDEFDDMDYKLASPFSSMIYTCTGYGDANYQYFDGLAGPDRDQEFTIDIEHGTTDW